MAQCILISEYIASGKNDFGDGLILKIHEAALKGELGVSPVCAALN
jgi:hypothetical protein